MFSCLCVPTPCRCPIWSFWNDATLLCKPSSAFSASRAGPLFPSHPARNGTSLGPRGTRPGFRQCFCGYVLGPPSTGRCPVSCAVCLSEDALSSCHLPPTGGSSRPSWMGSRPLLSVLLAELILWKDAGDSVRNTVMTANERGFLKTKHFIM